MDPLVSPEVNRKKNSQTPTLVLVRDLIFASRIAAEAKAQSVPIQVVRETLQLLERDGDKLIVDLNQDGALDAAAQWRQRTGKSVIGFVSHVDTATILRARELAIDHVLPRSAFVQQLPQLLKAV